jgi:hypothetical protein
MNPAGKAAISLLPELNRRNLPEARAKAAPIHLAIDLHTQREGRMKYMIEYTIGNTGLAYEENFANRDALLKAFSKWKPEDGFNVQAFVSDLANNGYVLLEAEDPKVVASFVGKFTFWNDVRVNPVIDIMEAVPVAGSALAWARSAV